MEIDCEIISYHLIRSVLQDPTTTTSITLRSTRGQRTNEPRPKTTWSSNDRSVDSKKAKKRRLNHCIEMSEELMKWLLEDSTVSIVQLMNNVVCRAAERLQNKTELDHVTTTNDLHTVCLLLRQADESGKDIDQKNLTDTVLKLLHFVCIPYLDILFQDCTSHILTFPVVAETLASMIKNKHLISDIAVNVLRDCLCPLLTSDVSKDSIEQLESLTTFLCHVFSNVTPSSLHSIPNCSEQLSVIFPHLISLLDHAPTTICHHLLTSLLPIFITHDTQYVRAVWSMVRDVWCGRRLVELHPLIMSLAILCCFSDVLIARDNSSPFITRFPSEIADLCPLLDVRADGVLWEVLGAGLRSNDPLDRKRSMYLLDR